MSKSAEPAAKKRKTPAKPSDEEHKQKQKQKQKSEEARKQEQKKKATAPKGDSKKAPGPHWTAKADKAVEGMTKEYFGRFGEYVSKAGHLDTFPGEDHADEIFGQFKPFTKFNKAAGKKLAQAIREWQYVALELRDNNVRMSAGVESFDNRYEEGDVRIADKLDAWIDRMCGSDDIDGAPAASATSASSSK